MKREELIDLIMDHSAGATDNVADGVCYKTLADAILKRISLPPAEGATDKFREVLTEVFEFVYTDCIYESAMATMSVHRTKKGAYKAMREFLETEYAQWREYGIRYGKQRFKFGTHCAWAVRSIALKE